MSDDSTYKTGILNFEDKFGKGTLIGNAIGAGVGKKRRDAFIGNFGHVKDQVKDQVQDALGGLKSLIPGAGDHEARPAAPPLSVAKPAAAGNESKIGG